LTGRSAVDYLQTLAVEQRTRFDQTAVDEHRPADLLMDVIGFGQPLDMDVPL
jgi:hypothetical protein